MAVDGWEQWWLVIGGWEQWWLGMLLVGNSADWLLALHAGGESHEPALSAGIRVAVMLAGELCGVQGCRIVTRLILNKAVKGL